ncbi:MAG: S4 domain-containing protein [Pseudomonadota bacterium]
MATDPDYTSTPRDAGVRIDKWLWAARFFRTRSLAAQAVRGGRVHLNGGRVKPARAVAPGDVLEISRGRGTVEVVVDGVAARRGSAKEAALLYTETPDSQAQRAAAAERRRVERGSAPVIEKRPDKRERRRSIRITRGD